jgi:CBS domain-containing protein
MTRDVVTADPLMSVEEAADTMLRYEVSALPVLDEGRLVGILTTADVLRLTAGYEREF